MKSVIKKASLVIRLGLTGAVLLLSQQSFAAGTIAGTDIDNRATVGYSVNTVAQTGIESSPTGNSTPGPGAGVDTTFVVDNRVDFSVVVQDGTQVPIELGEADVATQFLLSNDGNEVQDFLLNPTQHLTGDPDPFLGINDDTTDVASITAYVDDGDNLWDPLLDTGTWVDELVPDDSIIIWVSATGPATGVTGDIANINLEVTVANGNGQGAGGQGDPTTQDDGSADNAATVQVVFADGAPVFPALGDGVENDDSGYTVESATLSVLKDSDVISDPFNGTTNPKAIPGAVIEYSILVENTGTVIATDVSITDVIQLPLAVALATGGYNLGAADIQITVGAALPTFCLADALIADGCTFGIPADTFVIGRPGVGGLTIPVGETATILYQVTIL
jgi:uncharacterized repeat protein (TIGR01451 family)